MSTGAEIVPITVFGAAAGSALAVGAVAVAGTWGAMQVADALGEARVVAEREQRLLDSMTLTFDTAMCDTPLALRALEASGVPATSTTDDRIDIELDGHAAHLERSAAGNLQVTAPLQAGEELLTQFARDLDIEYRRLAQSASYERVMEQARAHGLTIDETGVDETGAITVTLRA